MEDTRSMTTFLVLAMATILFLSTQIVRLGKGPALVPATSPPWTVPLGVPVPGAR